ncbi:MAG: hypothetical protein CMD96_06060 [Gammaproteobacteria bacterium]|nr:hypothetical protein [Gammaproteobacteria bacterium]
MSSTVIKVESVSKKFCSSLKQTMFYGARDLAVCFLGLNHHSERLRNGEFWAVDDISFDLKHGECLGIIGPNGSGKSSLLKMLNGIFMPDKGKIEIEGRMGSLIEVGAGFHPMLTGGENVYVNGAILGMSKNELDEKFDKIVDFAGIEKFMDSPVKYYSSGMYVRLGFAVTVHAELDILIIDEVLAVGDVFFQAKCVKKLQDMLKKGVAVLLVSHDMGMIRSLCDRTILIDKGRIVFEGDSAEAVEAYHALRAWQLGAVDLKGPAVHEQPTETKVTSTAPKEPHCQTENEPESLLTADDKIKIGSQRYGNGKGRLVSYTINGKERCLEISINSGKKLDVNLEFSIEKAIFSPVVGIMIRTWHGIELFGNNTTFANTPLGPVNPGDSLKFQFSQHLHLNNGHYLMTLTLAEWSEKGDLVYVDRNVDAVLVQVSNGPFPYSGVCNLQGTVTVEKL